MKKLFLLLITTSAIAFGAVAQVKIGHNAETAINAGAIIELSNDITATATTWKALVLPYVDFSKTSFTDNTNWGIAGTPASGVVVYNTGIRNTDGFKGPGVYIWDDNKWNKISQ